MHLCKGGSGWSRLSDANVMLHQHLVCRSFAASLPPASGHQSPPHCHPCPPNVPQQLGRDLHRVQQRIVAPSDDQNIEKFQVLRYDFESAFIFVDNRSAKHLQKKGQDWHLWQLLATLPTLPIPIFNPIKKSHVTCLLKFSVAIFHIAPQLPPLSVSGAADNALSSATAPPCSRHRNGDIELPVWWAGWEQQALFVPGICTEKSRTVKFYPTPTQLSRVLCASSTLTSVRDGFPSNGSSMVNWTPASFTRPQTMALYSCDRAKGLTNKRWACWRLAKGFKDVGWNITIEYNWSTLFVSNHQAWTKLLGCPVLESQF